MKFRLIIVLASIGALLSACALHPPQDQTDRCTDIKRQINYYESTSSTSAAWVTDSQKEALREKLKENHCQS